MSDIFIKKGRTYQDDAMFRRSPIYKLAEKKAAEKMKKVVFDSPGAKSDYMRRVNAHPNNIPGMPIFFGTALIPKKHWAANDAYREEMILKGIWKECECGATINPRYDHECQQKEAV